jgi:hypothetical protein
VEAEFAFDEDYFDCPLKNLSEYLLRQKESIARIGAHPALMIEGQSSEELCMAMLNLKHCFEIAFPVGAITSPSDALISIAHRISLPMRKSPPNATLRSG